MMRATSATPLAARLLAASWLAACTAAPAAAPTPVVKTEIEPSEGLETSKPRLGEGDEEAQRCFRQASGRHEQQVSQCRDGGMEACEELARQLTAELPTCAAKISEVACDANHARSCAALAKQLLAQPMPPATRVRKLLERACEGQVGAACRQLGELEKERLGGLHPSVTKLMERGCDAGDAEACLRAVPNRSLLDQRGARLLERGCDLGQEQACMNLGMALLVGMAPGGVANKAKGEQILDTVCLGNGSSAGEACWLLSQLASKPRAPYLKRACDRDHFNACVAVIDAHRDAGRSDEAVALAGKMLAKHPNQWFLHWVRGSELFNSGKHAEAVADLQALIPLRPDWPLISIWLYAARGRSGGDGKAELAKAFEGMDKTQWPAPVFRYVLGKMSVGQLLKAAKDSDAHKQKQQECEAYYYIGQHWMVRGNTAKAKAMFRKSIDTQILNYIEYTGSKRELALLAP